MNKKTPCQTNALLMILYEWREKPLGMRRKKAALEQIRAGIYNSFYDEVPSFSSEFSSFRITNLKSKIKKPLDSTFSLAIIQSVKSAVIVIIYSP